MSHDDIGSGTIVVRVQHDEMESSSRTPKSRLGFQEKTSTASTEDSATNLAEVGTAFFFQFVFFSCETLKWFTYLVLDCIVKAKAALQAGRRGNVRDRLGLGKPNSDAQETKLGGWAPRPNSARFHFYSILFYFLPAFQSWFF